MNKIIIMKRICFIIVLFYNIFPAIAAKNTFTLWQLPSQINTIGNP